MSISGFIEAKSQKYAWKTHSFWFFQTKSLNGILWSCSLVNFFQNSFKISPDPSSSLANLQEYTQVLRKYVLCMMSYPYPLNPKTCQFSIFPDSNQYHCCMTFSHHDRSKLTYPTWLGVNKNWISHFSENPRWLPYGYRIFGGARP